MSTDILLQGFLFTLNFSFKYIVDLETLLTD